MDEKPPAGMAERFFGGLLMGAGILIGGTAGLCSSVAIFIGLRDAMTASSGSARELVALGLPMVLLFGGIPLVIGIGLFFIGRKLRRGRPGNPASGGA